MITQRFAVAALALGLVVGSGRSASAQFGGMGGIDPEALSSVGSSALIAVETPEKDGLKAYSIDHGTWATYRAPKGTRVRPIIGMGGHFVAAIPEGAKITQLAAYSQTTRSWSTQELKEPAEGKVWGPVVSSGVAVYVAGRHVYAYAAESAKWAVLELPQEAAENSEIEPVVNQQVATVTYRNRLYIFNGKFGRWDDSGDKPK